MLRSLCLALTLLLPAFATGATMLKCQELKTFDSERRTQWIQVSILPSEVSEGWKAFVFLRSSLGTHMQTEEQAVRLIKRPFKAFTAVDRRSDFYLRVDQVGDQLLGQFVLTTLQGEIRIRNMQCQEVEVRTAAECANLLD